MKNLLELIIKSRTFRRFHEAESISSDSLRSLVQLARLSSSSANLQGLKFYLVGSGAQKELVFDCLKFGGYLTDWAGPQVGERPAAYIIIIGDTTIKEQFDIDAGIAVQSMKLGATEMGLGSCIVGAVDRQKLSNSLNIPEQYRIILVLAIGRPAEIVYLEDLDQENGIKYYRDEQGAHHVPKRSLDELILSE